MGVLSNQTVTDRLYNPEIESSEKAFAIPETLLLGLATIFRIPSVVRQVGLERPISSARFLARLSVVCPPNFRDCCKHCPDESLHLT